MDETLQKIYSYYKEQNSLGQSELVIAMLNEIQDAVGYIPEAAQDVVADTAGVNRGYISAVIKNMPRLHLQPFKHEITVCTSDRCLKNGSKEVLKKFQQQLKIKPGQVTKDGTFLLKIQHCMHNCAKGPNIKIDGNMIEHFKPSDVPDLIRRYEKTDKKTEK